MEQLGIEPKLLLAQIINFAIIVVVLSKLLYKPILSMLEKRKKEIAAGLAITENMRQEQEKLEQKKEKILETARKEAQDIIEEGRKMGQQTEKDIVAAAHEEAAAARARGKAELEALRTAQEQDMKKASIELAVAMAKRLLAGVLTSEDKHKLLQKQLKELEAASVKSL